MTHNEVVTIGGVEYEAQFEVEPAQKGGWEDESWPAHVIELRLYENNEYLEYDDVSEGGTFNSELYSDIEKQLNNKLLERDYE